MNNENEGLIEYEDNGEYLVSPSYLFTAESSALEFVAIQEELEQLHSYCLVCLQGTASKVRNLEVQRERFEQGHRTPIPPKYEYLGVDAEDEGAAIDFQLPFWHDTNDFLAKAMCLLLLTAFLERSLKWLCRSYSSDGKIPRSVQKTSDHIEFLKSKCGFNFEEPDEVRQLRGDIQKVRNSFAHGDWDDVRKTIQPFSLRTAFTEYGKLLRIIEEAYMTTSAHQTTS
jgi:hypothetical protein